jgi:hypothetical protein
MLQNGMRERRRSDPRTRLKCPVQMEAKKDLSAQNQKTGLIEGGFNLAMS